MAGGTLVDSNVLLDVMTDEPIWAPWSATALVQAIDRGPVVINPIIYAEVSLRFNTVEELEDTLSPQTFHRQPLPWVAGFLAGKAFVRYRRSGGTRQSPLPDFYIGAHAAVNELRLLTRDPDRYRTYFPTVQLSAP